jgi:hypothetical protein
MRMANTNHNDQLIRQNAKEQLSQLNQIRPDNQLNFNAAEFLQWIVDSVGQRNTLIKSISW